jgi:hypothetical protein
VGHELGGERGELVVVTDPIEQLVAEVPAQPCQRDTDRDGVYDCWLTAAPLPVTGAVGAPVNPIAVK